MRLLTGHIFILISHLTLLRCAEKVSYEGYRVVTLGPLRNIMQVNTVRQVVNDWASTRQVVQLKHGIALDHVTTIAISDGIWKTFRPTLEVRQIQYKVVDENLQKSIDDINKRNEEAKTKYRLRSWKKFEHDAYMTYDEQCQWMSDVSSAVDPDLATVVPIATTDEGQTVQGIFINVMRSELPLIWIDANMGASEWITSATVIYLIDQLLTGSPPQSVDLRTNYRFLIVPNANPDGYRYSWEVDRLWTKTRSMNSNDTDCYGVNLNFNFDANFYGLDNETYGDPCSEFYRGPSAFSEPETQGIRDQIVQLTENHDSFSMLFSFHSYGQQWLVPWACFPNPPQDFAELSRIAALGVRDINLVNNATFVVGQAVDLRDGVQTGAGYDWGKLQMNISYTYGLQMRPATAGDGGYIIDPSIIVKSGQEILAGLHVAISSAILKKPPPPNRTG